MDVGTALPPGSGPATLTWGFSLDSVLQMGLSAPGARACLTGHREGERVRSQVQEERGSLRTFGGAASRAKSKEGSVFWASGEPVGERMRLRDF